jgi:hypothetical protein
LFALTPIPARNKREISTTFGSDGSGNLKTCEIAVAETIGGIGSPARARGTIFEFGWIALTRRFPRYFSSPTVSFATVIS